ncbi:MAG: ABC transporter permease [Azospirillaceae bacterium]
MTDQTLDTRRAEAGGDAAETRRQPVPFRAGGFISKPKRWASWLAFVCIIAVWELAGQTGLVSPVYLPKPSDVIGAFVYLFETGNIWRHLSDSGFRLLIGWSLGTVCGLVLGFAVGIWSIARAVGVPVVSALFPIPKIALLPLLILWFGIGEGSKVATIAFGVFFPTVIATFSGVDGVPRNLIRMAQSFDVPGYKIIWKVVLPGTLPAILAGFRITTSIALILLVAAEMIGARYGIGAFILTAGNLYQTDQLLAGVVMLSILGLIFAQGIGWLERRMLAWR